MGAAGAAFASALRDGSAKGLADAALVLEPHAADIQDRDGGGPLLAASRHAFPFIKKVFADGGYAGDRVASATAIAVEIVRKKPDQIGFAVQPRRWVVERFFAWISRNRRLAKDYENLAATLVAFVTLAAIRLAIKRLARPT